MTRLVDADALLINLDGMMAVSPTGYIHGDTVADMISDAPTVDAVPVVHGRWIDETFKPYGLVFHQYRCNQCGDHAEYESPYCPNCGARMDEE